METKTLIILVTTCKCTQLQAYEIYQHITNFIGTRFIIDYDTSLTYQYIRVNTKFTREDVEKVLNKLSDVSHEILDHVDIYDCKLECIDILNGKKDKYILELIS